MIPTETPQYRHYDPRAGKVSYFDADKLSNLKRRDEPIYENDVIIFEFSYPWHIIQWYGKETYDDWFRDHIRDYDKIGYGFRQNIEAGFIGLVGVDRIERVAYLPSIAQPDLIKIDRRVEVFNQLKTLHFSSVADCFVIGNIRDYQDLKEIWDIRTGEAKKRETGDY